MAGCVSGQDWLRRHTGDAPPELRDRVRQWAGDLEDGPAGLAADLAGAGRRALSHVVTSGASGRQVALDLLAADALVTLALLAQAELDPAGLGRFADGLLGTGAGVP